MTRQCQRLPPPRGVGASRRWRLPAADALPQILSRPRPGTRQRKGLMPPFVWGDITSSARRAGGRPITPTPRLGVRHPLSVPSPAGQFRAFGHSGGSDTARFGGGEMPNRSVRAPMPARYHRRRQTARCQHSGNGPNWHSPTTVPVRPTNTHTLNSREGYFPCGLFWLFLQVVENSRLSVGNDVDGVDLQRRTVDDLLCSVRPADPDCLDRLGCPGRRSEAKRQR